MFHAKDGWHFGRRDDGGVRIEKRTVSFGKETILQAVDIDSDTWCSIVAAVSASDTSQVDTLSFAKALHSE